MDVTIEGLDMIVVERNALNSIIEEVQKCKIQTNFDIKNFLSTSKVGEASVRYLMNDVGIKYHISHLFNNIFKNFTCSNGYVDIENLELSLMSYDINYL